MTALSPAVLAHCTPRWSAWRARGRRGPHPCDACPLEVPCSAPVPRLTRAALDEYAERLNAAAEGMEERR